MNTKVEMIIFCRNIKRLRELNKLSKQEMAKKLHIGVKSLVMIESGKIPPRLSTKIIMEISREFGIAPNKLFSGEI